MLNRFYRASIFLLLTLLLAACQGAGARSDSVPLETNPAQAAEETTRASQRLVIYSGRSENLVAPIIEQFAQATGIQVDVRYGSTAQMAATLLEEGANSPADLFFAQDPGGLGAVAAAGLLAPLPEELASGVDPRFISPDRLWIGVSGRVRVVVFNTSLLTLEQLPADIRGFTDPQWKGLIGWAPTNGSFQAMVTAMRLQWGEEATRAWLQAVQANRPVNYEGNTAIVAAVGAGEVAVGFVNHYYLLQFLRQEGESFPARNHFFRSGGPESLLMVAGVGRLASGQNQANALEFIQFLLSPAAQQYFASQTFEYPVIEGVPTDPHLPPLSELASPAIPLTDLADLQGTVRLLQETGVLP